ncbi:MAG: N-acetylmuramoyl-L-alanine amidase [Candidatus Moraniibacteriota bacterium]
MTSIPKKYLFLLILIVLAGAVMVFVSGVRRQSFANTVPVDIPVSSSPDQGDQVADVPASDNSASSGTGQQGSEGVLNGGIGTAGNDTANSMMTEAKGVQGGETGGKGSADKTSPSIIGRLVSFGYEKRVSRTIDTVVVHSSYDALGSDPYSVSGVIAEYKQSGVSPHYLIDRKGTIYCLVADHDVAYHAGVSKMPDGRTGVNAFSIGIEVLEKDTDSPTSAQYVSLRSLITSLKSEYPIKYVLGHSDIAPGRKTDPWNFDWKEMKQ